MIEILKSDLPLEYQNFWYDIGLKVQYNIKGDVQVFATTTNQIIIKIFIEKFNYTIHFSFPHLLKDNEILQYILNGIKFNVYEEVFNIKE